MTTARAAPRSPPPDARPSRASLFAEVCSLKRIEIEEFGATNQYFELKEPIDLTDDEILRLIATLVRAAAVGYGADPRAEEALALAAINTDVAGLLVRWNLSDPSGRVRNTDREPAAALLARLAEDEARHRSRIHALILAESAQTILSVAQTLTLPVIRRVALEIRRARPAREGDDA